MYIYTVYVCIYIYVHIESLIFWSAFSSRPRVRCRYCLSHEAPEALPMWKPMCTWAKGVCFQCDSEPCHCTTYTFIWMLCSKGRFWAQLILIYRWHIGDIQHIVIRVFNIWDDWKIYSLAIWHMKQFHCQFQKLLPIFYNSRLKHLDAGWCFTLQRLV